MLKLHNILTRKKEIFKPFRKDWVGLYTCGPTVYNYAHIGNLRTYIFEDILRRTLEYAGYKVRQVMNITDVDDKIIREASVSEKNISEFVKPYEAAFFKDLAKLNIEKVWKYPKATAHIREMIKIIDLLLKRGFAYEMDGSVYFNISKFKKYGRLSRLKTRELKTGTRINLDEYDKKDIRDFVLWKKVKAREPFWKAPFGEGRPGWHIECSAMSMKYLGETFDIHAGGVDLIFPHHENEIAQSEGATGKQFARFFAEGEHLLVNGKKMSKSLSNILTLRDIEKRGFNPLAFRYLILTVNYRSKLNFTWESLVAAENSLKKLYDFIRGLSVPYSVRYKLYLTEYGTKLNAYQSRFQKAAFGDLDIPRALSVLWDIIYHYHKYPNQYDSKAVLALLYDFDRVFGLGLKAVKPEKIPQKIIELVKKREDLRKEKKWMEADKIREEIEKKGWIVEDTVSGPKIKRI